MKITTTAYNDMLKTVGSRTAESGGLLFGSRTDWVVTKFLYDENAKTTSSSYSFDVGYLNPMMDKLAEEGLQLLGFFHSHPQGYKQLSAPDKTYFQRQFKNIPVDKFYVPLMFPAVEGSYDFIPYVYHKDGRVEQVTLELVPDVYTDYVTAKSDREKETPIALTQKSPVPKLSTAYGYILWNILLTGLLLFALGMLKQIYTYFSHLLNSGL